MMFAEQVAGTGGYTAPVTEQTEENETKDLKLMGEDVTVIVGDDRGKLVSDVTFSADAVVAVDDDENELFYAKNVHKQIFPASLTKLMTAYVVFDKIEDLEQEFRVPQEATELPDPYAKICGLNEGDVLTIRQLLNATLVTSANDAAKALSIAVSGSEEAFVKLMNEEAVKIGATHSHFMNCHGLHDDNHYTTLYDLYLIFHEMLKNDEFRSIISQSSYSWEYTNIHGNQVENTVSSTNLYRTGSKQVPDGFTVIGGKTGTTNEAGSCMLCSFEGTDHHTYILGIMHAEDRDDLYNQFADLFTGLR